MKNLIISICAVVCTFALQAQTPPHISYTYDNGNRVQRKYIDMSMTRQTQNNNDVSDSGERGDSLKQDDPEPKPLLDKLSKHNITIFPNPTKGKIAVNITNLNSDEKAVVTIYDLAGKLYFQNSTSDLSTTIDISDRSSGTYFMRIEVAGKQTVWEIIKQ